MMKKNYYYLSMFVALLLSIGVNAQTLTETYNAGDIPTSYSSFDDTCTGPESTLSVDLPSGGPWEITGVDVEYDMTAASGAWMSEQRSLMHFQNNGVSEAAPDQGSGTGGTFSYTRDDLDIANGYFAGDTELIFEMRAWRTWGGTDCGTNYNKVDDGTWTITVHYQTAPSCIPPSDIEVSNIGVDEAEISWTEIGSASAWNIEYGPEGFSPGSGTVVAVAASPYTITGLNELTEYDVYVQSDCGGGDESSWDGPETFQTSADCSNYSLEITDTTDGSIVCKGSATLEAEASGDGNEIYWYDAATGGNLVGFGPEFETPELTATTSFWAVEVLVSGTTTVGQGKVAPTAIASTTLSNYGLAFEATQQFTITEVDVYPNAAGGDVTVELWDSTNTPIASTTATVPSGTGATPETITLNFDVPSPGNYRLMKQGGVNLVREFSGNSFPYALGTVGEILGGVFNTGATNTTYYFFYNWTISEGEVLCESAPEEVIATVTQDGDEIVGPLPYTHTENTSTYGNTFTGSPGNSCGTSENYLNGSDVVYQYSPANDIVINIDLSDLAGFYAGVFVYESCGDIGDDCIAGEVNGPSDNGFGIADLELVGGEDYYIVVSSWLTSDIDYTITISESTCPEPDNPVIDNLTNSEVEISWGASANDQDGYEWALMQPGDHPDSDTPETDGVTATGVTDVVVPVDPDTSYDFYVRTNCGATDGFSGWAGPLSFTSPITTGDIPTSFGSYDSACNGPNYTIIHELPSTGGPWEVTGIDIEYTMTAGNGAWMSEQRSLIHFQNDGVSEPDGPFQGTGFAGTFSYERNDVDIANGFYADGEELIFEMRAWRTFGNTAPNNGCGTYYNRVDDGTWEITVNYQQAPTCPAVDDIAAEDIADDEMEVSWTEVGTATSWNVEYGPEGFAQGAGTVETATASPYVIDGLTPGTVYDVYVQADCGSGDTSDWEGPVTVNVGIPSDTYNGGDIPTSYSGFDATCNGPSTTLSIDLPSSGGPWEVTGIDVQYDMTAAGGAWMSEQRSAIYCQNTGEQEDEDSGSGLAGTYSYNREGVEIANGFYPDGEELIFEMRAWRTFGISPDCGTNYNKVDDGTWTITVYYQEAPSCLPVQNAEVSALAEDEIEVTWDEIGSATEWSIEYGEEGFALGTGTTVDGLTSTDYIITGLDPFLSYEVYVQSNCGGGDTASWVGPISISAGDVCENAIPVWGVPYAHESDTGDYGDDYNNAPGSNCGSTLPYLNGDDVVYEFVPDEDMTIDISLSDLSGNYAGIFVYEDCADIGTTCAQGAVNGFGTADLLIEDYAVVEGQNYYIVISTWAAPQTVGYVLNITRDCATSPDMPVGDAEQGLCTGAIIADLDVTGDGLRWYTSEDSLLPISPASEVEDGDVLYVSQVVGGCESDRLAITIEILDISDTPLGTTNQTYVEGDTVEDLDVSGDNLAFYVENEDGNLVPIDEDTVLEDQTHYYVTQTVEGQCESDYLVVVVHQVLQVGEELTSELVYYPNPVANQLTVTNSTNMDKLEMYNLLGQKVLEQTIDAETATVDMSSLASGAYMMKVYVGKETGVYRILKK